MSQSPFTRITFSSKRPFEQALAEALSLKDSGRRVVLSGKLADITPPEGSADICEDAWQRACLIYCATNQMEVGLHAVRHHTKADSESAQKSAFAVSLATGVLIEMVRQERSKITRETRAERTGYVCGRPPYGYKILNGEFAIDDMQSRAVRFIFDAVRSEHSLSDILKSLKSAYADHGPVRGRQQFWDRVKIKRILNHARLYCLGEYSGGRVKVPVTISNLQFLPKDWLDINTTTRPKARKASPCPRPNCSTS